MPERAHTVPCQGVPEIQRVEAVLGGRIGAVEVDVAALKEWQKRQNGTLQELHNDLKDSRRERYEQIESVSAQIRQMLILVITVGIPIGVGLLYVILNHLLVK